MSIAAANSGFDECTSITCSAIDGVDSADATGGNGAARKDSFHLRTGLSLVLGILLLLAVNV